MASRRRNPAVAQSERAAQAAEGIAENAAREGTYSSFPTRLAQRRRKTANKIRKERPNLIAYGE